MMQPLAQALNRWQLLFTLLMLAAAFLPGLGRAGLLDPWEMDRAAVSRTMAASPRVVVVEGPDGALLKSLEQKTPGQFGLVRAAEHADVQAPAALQQAVAQLNRRLAHAVVIDADAVLGAGNERSRIERLAGPLAQIEGQNLGTAVLLVTAGDARQLQRDLAMARARLFQKSLAVGAFAGMLGDEVGAAALAPLMAGPEWLTTPAQLAAALPQRCPSPWMMPLHKKDNASVASPWLDAALSGASLRALGPSEFAARLPAAFIAILTGLLLVMATARLWSPVEGWLALLVYATLPMTWGLARTVTFEATAPLGIALVTLGLALGVAKRSKSWWIWFGLGLGVLLLGRGLAGLTMAAGIAIAYVLATGDLRKRAILPAILATVCLAIAAVVVLGNDTSPLLRSFRFTQWPFGGGPDNVHRDFSWFIGQAGFGLYPWGAPFVLGLARLLGRAGEAEDGDTERRRAHIAVLLGAAVPLIVVAVLIRQFNHFVVPFAPLVAVATAVLLSDVRLGRVEGRLVAFFVVLATLMLHREIGKGADALTRFVAFDPPLAPETGTYPWPGELAMPKVLTALALLCVAGFALGVARPLAAIREQVLRLRGSRAAAWALGITGIVWALDALVSLGTKLDVLLKTNSMTSGYAYDRMWVTYQGTRPEVLAGAVTFALMLTAAAVATLADRETLQRHVLLRIPLKISNLVKPSAVALSLCGAASVGVLLSGLAVHDRVQHLGWGAALAAGLRAAAFLAPLKLAIAAALGSWLVRRAAAGSLFDPAREGSLFSPLWRALSGSGTVIVGILGLCALAGLGIGASQAAGTWSYPFLASCWALGLLIAHVVIGRADGDAGRYGWPLVAAGSIIASSIFLPLAIRYYGEIPARGEAVRYLVHVLLTAPDSGGLLWVALFLAVNRLAAGRAPLGNLLEGGLKLLGRLEQPRPAIALLAFAGVLFSAGFAFSLLPGLSVHYSQKHLLVRIAEAGGSGKDAGGAPKTFSHGSTKSGSDNNFYTQSMPAIEDRQTALALLADQEVEARITDNTEGSATRTVKLSGHPQRFLVVPKDAFSELNHDFRLAHDGQHVPVLDARSSRLVLAASKLLPGQEDENWLRKSVLTQAQFDALKGVTHISANFDNALQLIGFKLAENSVARSQKYKLTLYWKVVKATTTSWKLFMHPHPLHLDRWPLSPPDPSEDENKPCIGCFQTNHWLTGDIIADSFEQEVPLGTQSGPNEIILGWYNPSNDQRMPLLSASGDGVIKHGDNRVTIGNLQVR